MNNKILPIYIRELMDKLNFVSFGDAEIVLIDEHDIVDYKNGLIGM